MALGARGELTWRVAGVGYVLFFRFSCRTTREERGVESPGEVRAREAVLGFSCRTAHRAARRQERGRVAKVQPSTKDCVLR